MAYQSLYRRYRSRRFGELKGQDHVATALRNAVRESRVGHAYLFSGPRGTGKTSTARILAKALNCTDLQDGEPCLVCDSCVAIDAGTSYDVQELDAASNNKVDDITDLVGKVALGSPGRTKVYILDEVHMLTPAASAKLLKTLEEPPAHVVFVLATTDPQKLLATIRSRTQHFEFHLLPADVLAEHVRWVIQDAGLDVDEEGVQYVLRVGGGSARDTLSALDRVAAGGMVDEGDSLDDLLEALVTQDAGGALAAVASAVAVGRDPRVLGEQLLGRMRDVFLVRMRAGVDHLPEAERQRIEGWAERLGDRATTRVLEVVGDALVDMRQAPDPRVPLEVALVKLTRPSADASIEALVARIDALEAALAGGAPISGPAAGAAPSGAAPPASAAAHGAPPPPDAPTRAPAPTPPSAEPVARPAAPTPPTGGSATQPAPPTPPTPARGRPADAARAQLAARRAGGSPSTPPRPPAAAPSAPSAPAAPPVHAEEPGPGPAPAVGLADEYGEPIEPSTPSAVGPSDAPPARSSGPDGSGAADAPEPDPSAGPSGAPAPAPSGSAPTASTSSGPSPASPAPASARPAAPAGPDPEPAPPSREASTDGPPAAPAGAGEPVATGPLDLGAVTAAWAAVSPSINGRVRGLYDSGTFAGVDGGTVTYAMTTEVLRGKYEQARGDVERALADHLGRPVTLQFVVGGAPGAPSRRADEAPADGDVYDDLAGADVHELEDAPDAPAGGLAALTQAFPGAQLIETDES